MCHHARSTHVCPTQPTCVLSYHSSARSKGFGDGDEDGGRSGRRFEKGAGVMSVYRLMCGLWRREERRIGAHRDLDGSIISMCLRACLCVHLCMFLCPPLHVLVSISACLCVYLCLSLCPPLHVFVSTSACPCVYLCISLCLPLLVLVSTSACPCVHL